MDEPDFNELTWMAMDQGMQDEAEFADVPESEDILDHAPPSSEDVHHQPNPEGINRKRDSADSSSKSAAEELTSREKRRRALSDLSVPASEPTGTSTLPASVSTVRSNEKKNHKSPEEYVSTGYRNKNAVFRMVNSIDGDFATITAPSGTRVYAERKRTPDSDTKSTYSHVYTHMSKTKGLLLQSIEKMIEVAERERLRKMFSEDSKSADPKENLAGQTVQVHEKLWVEKYAPKAFTDLLSDEQTNREVLRWLKQWDSTVFGNSDNIPTSKDVLAALRRKSISRDGRNGQKDFRRNQFESKGVSTDHAVSHSRNQSSAFSSLSNLNGNISTYEDTNRKVLLLCGPPGLGKTTLAHIVANHCGYRVVEINASDDRVAATLQAKILDAVQMKSVAGDTRPNCLIIDEIDGAIGGSEGRSALRHLIDIVSRKKKTFGTGKKPMEDGPVKKPAKRTSGAASETLARPIICICNDLYAPALRPLRQVARCLTALERTSYASNINQEINAETALDQVITCQIHAFSKPSTSRIVSRLKYICEEEGYRTSIRALSTLAERTECDIRACLNALQFLKRKGKHLASLDGESLRIGYKDMTTNILEIWAEVYHHKKDSSSRPLMQQGRTAGSGGGQELPEFTRLYDLLANHGDHDLAIEGLHENLLHVRYQDPNLSKTIGCLRAICDSDIRSKGVHSKQQFILNAYQPAAPITVRHLVAVQTKPGLQWPKAYQRYRTELSIKTEMLSSWISAMSPAISRTVSPCLLSIEMMTRLLAILTPPLRPVAVQLYTATELETMKQVVDTMVQYGLTYKEGESNISEACEGDSKIQGQGEIQLDPPINSLVHYEGYKVPHRQLSTTMRRFLGHQVEQEKLRREVVGLVKSLETPFQETHSVVREELGKSKLIVEGEANKPEPTSKQLASEYHENKVFGSNPSEAASISMSAGEARSQSLKIRTPPKGKTQISLFDRLRKGGPSANQNTQSSGTNQRDLRPLLYKFHEGFTNAIRRPLLIRELL